MTSTISTVHYRAGRLRFIICALVFLPISFGLIAMIFVNAANGDRKGVAFALLIAPIYLWFDYIIIAKLLSPPEIEISQDGIRLSNRALLVNGSYLWNDVDGPTKSSGTYGVPILDMTVKSSGKKIRMPPSHFGSTYDEMADVISNARSGYMVDILAWRAGHPQHKLLHWCKDWGLPLLVGGGFGLVLAYLKL